MLAGDDQATSPAYEWWCAAYEKDGMMASTAFRVLKDVSDRDSFQGSVRCALPPFHEMKEGETWRVCRPVEANDADGERGGRDYLTEGTSTRGLTGVDATEGAHYFWALRAFVAELEAKFLMKGTKEKEDLLVAKPQTPEQDGMAYVKLCMRRETALNAGKMVEDITTRQNIEDYIKWLRIKEYTDRVSEQLRVQFPVPNKVTWKDLEVIVEVQDKLKNHAESWALTFQQDITRRSSCVYSCYEARKLGIDLSEMVAAMRRSGAAKKAEAGDRRNGLQEEGTDCTCWDAHVPQEFHNKNRRAQALLEDELECQCNFNEREEYAPEDHIDSAVALGNTQKMQGFPLKTPEEFDKDAQVPRAVSADLLSRKVHLLASNLRSAKQSCSQLAAAMVIQGLIQLPKDIDAFLALEEIEGRGFSGPVDRAPAEINKHQVHDSPETVLSKAGMVSTRCEGQTDDQELPLDEMPDGVVDLVAARWAAAACVNDCGVVDFSEHGHVRAGTTQNQAYEALRMKMKDHLTEDQALQMAQNYEKQRVVSSAERPEHFEDLLAPQSPLPQEEPDSSEPGPSAPQGTVKSLQREAMMWTCPMNRGRRSQLPPLSTDFLEESRRALASSSLVPWVGSRVKPWGDSFDASSCRDTWKNQRLYRDKTNVARLWHIVRADSTSTEAPSLEDHVRVEFARCGKQMWVLESQLRWSDWLGIDQKMPQYITEDGTWGFTGDYTTYVPPTGKEVVMPKYPGLTVDNSKLKRLQMEVEAMQKYPSGEVAGTLMWI
ncbi:hypothetical protein CYMTET_29089 [Cymbomonas tetramitiformis]|uniref:Uncharacterized protein n=1 Tax=Cymbomonas tetramitiformis TaxID=36881 RepID=A0AAE0KV94_9CHLO|nr:hypothetical protein CYMTET_29089 [Cymbomonas tetramitiformis]